VSRRGAEGGGRLDFASALYLGMRHPWAALGPWSSLTTGLPAVLEPPPGAGAAARRLARLQGCEAALFLPSTLHLFWDLFGVLAPGAGAVLVDEGAYAVARWGVERARCAGVPARTFGHHSAAGLRRALRAAGRGRPVVVCDGFCPGCGRSAPLPEYLDAVRAAGGLLVVDDTQALGIWGEGPAPGLPYGRGGGGSLRRWGIEGPELLVGASLAKGFGAPLAALSGSREWVGRFAAASRTRVHGSPPSIPAVRAAARALALNRARGDRLRERLAAAVERFRGELAERGVRRVAGGCFPVQTLPGLADAGAVHARLEREGIRAVLRAAPGPVLTFLLRADHEEHDLARAACAVARAARAGNRGTTRCQP